MSDLDLPSDDGLEAGVPNVLMLPQGVYLADGIFEDAGAAGAPSGRFLILKVQLRDNHAPEETAETKHLMFGIESGKGLVNQLIAAINHDHALTSREEADRG